MGVPGLAAEEDLDEPHASFHEPACDQAARAVFAGLVLVQSVESFDVSRLVRDVERLFGGRLHGGGELVALNPGFEVGLARVAFEVPSIEPVEE